MTAYLVEAVFLIETESFLVLFPIAKPHIFLMPFDGYACSFVY